nr:reverse transcriptase domain-containing protein [Tanacetum cinerariifolium]
MPTWCHMFNSTLTGFARVWFDDLPPESIDSYDDLKKAFLANYLQQKKCIKDPVEIRHIKQSERESTKDFVQRFKAESRNVKGAPECMRISGFMHGITNPELIKRMHDNIPKNQQILEKRRNKFTLLTKSPKEILALDKGKFKAPPPMTTPVEKRNNNKFCEFHGEAPSGSKKPSDSSYRTPYWLQWRNHMANRTNIAAGKNKRYRAFHLHMDEIYRVRSPSLYNGIIGRLGVRKILAVPSTAHEMLKFPVPGEILALRSSKIIPLEFTMVSRLEA